MSTVEQIMALLEDSAKMLQKAQVNLKKCPKQRLTQGYIEARSKCIDEYWTTFKNAHQELCRCTPREKRADISYFVNEEYYLYEDLYLCLQADLKDMLLNTGRRYDQQQSRDIAEDPVSQVKLPRVQLPTFSGKYEEWPTFQDLFTSLVHNSKSLGDVQKLHYLKTSVAGEAEALLRHVQVTDANYTQAWDILKGRYGNKRLIVTSLLKRLFNQKKITTQSAGQIKAILDTTTECINNLNNLKIPTDSWDPLIIFLVVQKLDSESHKEWEAHAYKENSEDLPSWAELKKFLESKFRTLELITPYSSTANKERITPVRERTYHTTTTEKLCFMCNEKHTLCHCKEFTKMDPAQRSQYVRSNNLCYNCLLPGHKVFKCRIPARCRICHRRHHTLLHQKSLEEAVSLGQSQNLAQPSVTSHANVEEHKEEINAMIASNYASKGQQTALLATALITARNKTGHSVILRALIDPGSQANFISEKATHHLHLERHPAKGTVVGVGSTKTDIKQVVEVQVSPRWKSDSCLQIQAYVMSKQLTTKIPQNTIAGHTWKHLEGLTLADPNYYKPGSIDLLLGVKDYSRIVRDQMIKGPPGTPCAQKTSLGWILFGEIDTLQNDDSFLVMHTQVDVEEMLKTIWEIDVDTKRNLTKEERLCEDIYNETHKRTKDGKYIVKLPFKKENLESPEGNTRNIALQRLLQLERRFKRQPKLKAEYVKVIEDYLELGHLEEVPEKQIHSRKSVYMPHHPVIRDDKETTQTRIVFDASCKGDNGVSLNDEMLTGPVLQEDLRSIIMRWRTHAVAFIADIKKMYRMILLTRDDVDYQRILWRKNDDDEIKDYRLLTVTFGTAAAPYLAVRTLMQLANDESEEYPFAAKRTLTDFYVDDALSGCDTVEQAVELSRQLKNMMLRGGFELKKWSSNSTDFLSSLEPADRSSSVVINLNVEGTVKALGISWNLKTDQLQYSITFPTTTKLSDVTKRGILSDIQKLFDPLGWIAPSIIMSKILIQKLWQEGVKWDEVVKPSIAEEWRKIRSDFENVKFIQIDRWLHTISTQREQVQLHGFSDASIRAFAAVVYMRVEKTNGSIETSLIAARTRVAPVKTISLPRLELCGAVLLSKLLKHVAQAMRLIPAQIYAWTDSSIVLSWLSGDPNRWKTFIANRVVEITEYLNANQWYHVQSGDNPADVASRGMLLSDLKKCEIWWKGPVWLSEKKIKYTKPNKFETELEAKKEKIQTNLKVNDDTDRSITETFEDYDNLKQLVETIAYCIRFLNITKKPITDGVLTTEEIDNALQRCIKLTQDEEFQEEIQSLRSNKQVKTRSSLKSLTPYLDDRNILRVGGRLRHANLNHDGKHPIILGHNNKLVSLIITDAHSQTLHGGVQLMMSYIRSKYWIIRAKSLIKRNIRKCLVCARHNAMAKKQLMGDLPKMRVTPARPFTHSGVDFAGPIHVLWSKGRGAKCNKAYIAIFVCMATKAIHLELVGDLTSEAFIGAFRRFTSRRGKCSHLWSDQGRNFIGANKELVTACKEANLDFTGQIIPLLIREGTQWHFIPAYSPNFGGLWEAGVKSIKYHLKRILTSNLTFEETTTVLCEIEACLNSRPLSPIDDTDTDNLQPLTPGHFLIGEAPVVVPSPDIQHIKINNLSRWQYTQKLMADFWKRWQSEYLSRLQQRPKWYKKEIEFQKGDIVLIKIENLPPGKWALGRITEKHPGPDGITRVYSVKSGDSTVKRCITKLCALPIEAVN